MPLFRTDGEWHFFAHVPKTGGTTIEKALTKTFGRLAFYDPGLCRDVPRDRRWCNSTPQHIYWSDLDRVFPSEYIESTFAVVRHPAPRLASAYNSYVSIGVLEWQDFDAFLDRAEQGGEPHPFVFDAHTSKQVAFVPPHAEVFKLEDGLDPVWRYLTERFGRIERDTGHVNRTARNDRVAKVEPMSPAQIARVAELYREDFDRFGYAPDPDEMPKLFTPNGRKPFSIRDALGLRRVATR